jgi:heme exporter protein D
MVMIWNGFSDFLAMGGYGLYVWGSFGVSALLMALETLLLRRGRAAAIDQVRHEIAASQVGKDWH